jgi:hypothetical protein
MKKAMAAFFAVGLAMAVVSAADARSSGGVRPHYPPPVIGQFYSGRGYWDGHRYWPRRMRWHNGWRYGN